MPFDPGSLPPGVTDPASLQQILAHIDAGATMIGGFVLALIVASTWRG